MRPINWKSYWAYCLYAQKLPFLWWKSWANYTKVVREWFVNIVWALSGPKHLRLIELTAAKRFQASPSQGFRVEALGLDERARKVGSVQFSDHEEKIKTGHVAIAAISCANTSNPLCPDGGGSFCQKTLKRLTRFKDCQTSLAPGSKVVTELSQEEWRINLSGSTWFQCVSWLHYLYWNSGNLRPEVGSSWLPDTDLLASAVLSGNRNFEGRINPLVKARISS